MATWFVDINNPAGSGNGSTFANKAGTLAAVTGAAAGDTIRIAKSPDSTSMGQNATFTNKSLTVTLTSAVTTNIYLDGAWTATTNVTCSTDTTNKKEGANASSIVIASAFTTGLAAYYATGTLDLSSKQQISFWIRTNANVAANSFRIDLCSDAAGATPVNSFTINRALNSGQYTCFTFDNGSALGSAIQSVALNCLLDPGAVTVLIDNIIACKASSAADSLSLNSLISPDNSIFWPIKSINGTMVVIDQSVNSMQGAGRGFSGTTATTTCYKRECVVTPSVTYAGAIGTAGSHVSISGGWDTASSMTTQTGLTFFDGSDGFIELNTSGLLAYLDWSNLGFARYYSFRLVPSNGSSLNNVHFIGSSAYGLSLLGTMTITNVWIISCGGGTHNWNSDQPLNSTFDTISILSCGGIFNNGNGNLFQASSSYKNITAANSSGAGVGNLPNCINLTVKDNANTGIQNTFNAGLYYNVISTGNGAPISLAPGPTKIYGLTSSSNTTAGVSSRADGAFGCEHVLYNANISEALKFRVNQGKVRFYSHREGGTSTANTIYTEIGNITSQTAVTKTGSGIAWQFTPASTLYSSQFNPLFLSIGKFAIKSGVTQTFTYWCRRDDTNLNMQLRIPGGRFPGVGSAGTDITTTVNPSINTWTQYSIACTPTEDCVVEIFADAWDNNATTHNGYIDGTVTIT